MQNLRDKLLRAGLVDRKRKKQADHQLREERARTRKEGVDPAAESARHLEARQREIEERTRQERERQLLENERLERLVREKQEEQLRVEEQRKQGSDAAWQKIKARSVLESNLFLPQAPGPVRFHFVARSGGVRFIQISTRLAHDLAAGLLAIGQLPCWGAERFGLVRRDVAETLLQMDATLVRFFLRDKEQEMAPPAPVIIDPRPRSLSPPRRWHFSGTLESAGERRD